MISRKLSVAAVVSVAIACRPPIPGEGSPNPSSVAGDLVASAPVTVIVHLPTAPNALSAPFVYAQAAESIAAANVTLDFTTPSPGEPLFASRTSSDRVDLFVATTSAVVAAGADGDQLVRIASLQQRSDWEIVVTNSSPINDLAGLLGKRIYVDGAPGDDAPLVATLAALGIDQSSTTFTYSEDLSTPFDPVVLFDGIHDAALVHHWDGALRTAQGFDTEGNPIGESGIRTLSVIEPDSPMTGGYSLWVDRAALETPDLVTSLAATLIGIAAGFDSCRRMILDCAQALADSGLADQSSETLAWGIAQFLDSVFPTKNPILSFATQDERDELAILDRAEGNWPPTLDRLGADWKHANDPIPLE